MENHAAREADSTPRISVEQTSRLPGARSGEWLVGWSIGNLTVDPLTLDSAWLPHGQFRGERTALASFTTLGSGESAQIELPVHCDEPAASVVENAFLILTARWRGEPWRVLTRLTVRFDQDRAPNAETETMTIQPIGFSARREPSVE